MPLLLILYLAPVLALALFWRAWRRLPDAPVWKTLVAAGQGRIAMLRGTAGAGFFATAVVAATSGASGALAFLVGVTLVVVSSALAIASTAALQAEAGSPDTVTTGGGKTALGQVLSASSVGALGALAWFFADPAGVVVLAAFAAGVSSAALFLAIALGPRPSASRATQVGFPVHSHLAAVAAAMMFAATAEPDALLSLGGLLAETETLRSELLLLPVAVTVMSPLVALFCVPAAAMLAGRDSTAGSVGLERLSALMLGFAAVLLVGLAGLAWIAAGAFVLGLLARQAAVLAGHLSERSPFRGRRETPTLVSTLVSAAALVCGERLAGGYGATLAALGMTAGFASACAAASTGAVASRAAGAGPDVGEAAATIAATLALLVVVSPVLVAETAQRGLPLAFVVTAAPALLAGVLAGSACAAAVAARFTVTGEETEAVTAAARAVVIAAGLPAAAGLVLGAGAAVGVALGFLAWSAVSSAAEEPSGDGARMPRDVLLACGRTMAIVAVVAVPAMT